MSDVIQKEAQSTLKYWSLYYHLLFWLHTIFGALGVIIGTLIAADVTFAGIDYKTLGVFSTVIVGVVSFIQPGRMASIFYDAYWHLRVAILSSLNSETGDKDLIASISDGYTTIAKAQPQALSSARNAESGRIDQGTLSPERQAVLKTAYEELLAAEAAEKETAGAEKPKFDGGV